jgi:acyl-coenzyme A synthetase/AMP-(fatty) acid ligase
VVVPAPGAEPDGEALRGHVRSRLAAYKVPKDIVLSASLPRNAMGKVQKPELSATLRAGLSKR